MIVRIRISTSQRAGWREFAAGLRRGAITLGAVAALTLSANSSATLPPGMRRPPPDPRIARLERFFHRYGCPAPQHVGEYLRAADSYGLDYRLMPALSIRETHCGIEEMRDDHFGNNHWGYHPGRQSFASVEAGIDYVARELAQGFYYRGKSLRDKLFTYNPLPAYPGEIQHLMAEIDAGK